MKNTIIKGFFIALLLFVSLPVRAEVIHSFDTAITVQKEGVIKIEEKINYDFESVYRHGIYRYIPQIKKNTDGKQRIMDVRVEGVTDENGIPYHYSTSFSGGTLTIKIGDADRTITGIHTYRISYTVSGALTYFSDHDELYWNVTGNGWEVPIESARTSVSLPGEVPSGDIKNTCYTGVAGSTATDCQILAQGNMSTFTTTNLNGGEGQTVVVGFPKGHVAVVEPKIYTPFEETWYGKLLISLFFIILAIVSFVWYIGLPIFIPYRWYRFGRDPKSMEARAWYDPPKTKEGRGLTPAETGTLIDETANVRDIFGSLIQLAQRGYLSIKEEKKGEFTLIEGKEAGNELLPFEKKLLTALFEDGSEIKVKDAKIAEDMEDVKKKLYVQVVGDGFFPESPESVRTRYYILAGFALFTGNFPLAVIAFLFGRNMPRKTEEGAQQAAVARSLRTFLTSQERQLEFQAKAQMMFEKLLPYAIAFGVEKIWADRFKDMSLPSPSWYTGYNNSAFNAVYFASTMNRNVGSFTTAVTPTRSSSGYSSGFSGGFSGGGGGGGGGGSW